MSYPMYVRWLCVVVVGSQDFGAVEYLRLRVIPVLGTSPSIFGQAMAAYALCQLSGHVYNYDGGERMSKNLRHKLRQVFKNNEVRLGLLCRFAAMGEHFD